MLYVCMYVCRYNVIPLNFLHCRLVIIFIVRSCQNHFIQPQHIQHRYIHTYIKYFFNPVCMYAGLYVCTFSETHFVQVVGGWRRAETGHGIISTRKILGQSFLNIHTYIHTYIHAYLQSFKSKYWCMQYIASILVTNLDDFSCWNDIGYVISAVILR